MNSIKTTEFDGIHFADGHVSEISYKDACVRLRWQDWQENEWIITFHNALAFEVLDIENEDLSHGSADTDDPFLDRVVNLLGEEKNGFKCFKLWSAWQDEPLLRIVAKSFSMGGNQTSSA
jgi:hypothetical protein